MILAEHPPHGPQHPQGAYGQEGAPGMATPCCEHRSVV